MHRSFHSSSGPKILGRPYFFPVWFSTEDIFPIFPLEANKYCVVLSSVWNSMKSEMLKTWTEVMPYLVVHWFYFYSFVSGRTRSLSKETRNMTSPAIQAADKAQKASRKPSEVSLCGLNVYCQLCALNAGICYGNVRVEYFRMNAHLIN